MYLYVHTSTCATCRCYNGLVIQLCEWVMASCTTYLPYLLVSYCTMYHPMCSHHLINYENEKTSALHFESKRSSSMRVAVRACSERVLITGVWLKWQEHIIISQETIRSRQLECEKCWDNHISGEHKKSLVLHELVASHQFSDDNISLQCAKGPRVSVQRDHILRGWDWASCSLGILYWIYLFL